MVSADQQGGFVTHQIMMFVMHPHTEHGLIHAHCICTSVIGGDTLTHTYRAVQQCELKHLYSESVPFCLQNSHNHFVPYFTAIVLPDALGGNSLSLMIGTVRQGDWEASSTTLRQLTTARGARNYPIINHSRARGLMHKLRFRLMSVMVSCSGQRTCVHAPGSAICMTVLLPLSFQEIGESSWGPQSLALQASTPAVFSLLNPDTCNTQTDMQSYRSGQSMLSCNWVIVQLSGWCTRCRDSNTGTSDRSQAGTEST